MGGSRKRFPETRHSLVRAAGDTDLDVRRPALEALIASYWKPAYGYVRIQRRASNEDAKDLPRGSSPACSNRKHSGAWIRRAPSFAPTCAPVSDGYVSNERKAAGAPHGVGHRAPEKKKKKKSVDFGASTFSTVCSLTAPVSLVESSDRVTLSPGFPQSGLDAVYNFDNILVAMCR